MYNTNKFDTQCDYILGNFQPLRLVRGHVVVKKKKKTLDVPFQWLTLSFIISLMNSSINSCHLVKFYLQCLLPSVNGNV